MVGRRFVVYFKRQINRKQFVFIFMLAFLFYKSIFIVLYRTKGHIVL